ncbi:uncharacterized protein LOC110026929 isoform X2 [Phalaenopsis equestris]|uniref:uncharacterized protein LOC110026929 isoform X2 n=1 Tax=Phalaenopsis equestris TaxID=78828 RepID=UPI0009E3C288|nr:uncharacterized protein LOC110026929 isoform X2 [Phalaenopsis equestris]
MEVDFKEFRRKDLQRLCKKHGLRANATNSQMADSLASFFRMVEKNKQGKVVSKGCGGNRSSRMEGVEGDAEKVVIVIDEDEDELGSVLRSADRKSSLNSRRSSEKDEQMEPRGEGPGGASLKLIEENDVIVLDEEDDELRPVLKSPDGKKSRRSSGKVGKACESGGSNEENQTAGTVTSSKEGLLAAGRITRSPSMNSEVAHSPFIKKANAGRQNGEPALDSCEVEGDEDVTREENSSVMISAGDVEVKRKWNNRNSSMKVNDEIVVCLPNEVSVTENLVGDVVHEKHVDTVMGSDITFSIDGAQGSQGPETRNEEDIEENELCTTGNLMEIVAGSVGTRRKKRTRAGLAQDSPASEQEIDELGRAHRDALLHRDEILEPEVCFGSSQILGSPLSSNPSSSPPCLLLSELHGRQDGQHFPSTDVSLSKQPGSLDRNKDLEMEECLVRKNFIITEITMVDVDDKFCRRPSTCELDHASTDGEASKQSLATALDSSQGHHNIKECFRSVSANLEDACNKCSIAQAHHNECGETEDSMNNLSLSGQDCETAEFSREATGFKAREKCQNFEEVRDVEEGEKIKKLFEDHETHKEKESGSERQDFNAAAITPNTTIETDSSNRHNNLELQELIIYRNSEATMNIFSDEKIDSCHSQLCSSFKTGFSEAKQQPKDSLSSGKAKIDLQKFESSQKFPDSQRVADTNSEQFLAPFESIAMEEGIHQIIGGEAIKLEGSVQIIQDKSNHDGERLCASEEQPQPVGHDEDSEAKYFAGDPPAKVDEAAPLSKRVDNLMEKLLCLTKVLRGEIVPLSTDLLSLPCEEAISCKESPVAGKKEMKSVESFSSHEQESQILNPAVPVHDDCEQDISKFEVNIPKKTDEVAIIISPDALQASSELGKCMKSCKRNNTAAASLYKCDFYIKPTLGKTCQAVNGMEFLGTRQGVLAEPEEALQDNKLVSPSNPSSFDLEGFLKSKLNNITNSPEKDINHFGSKCLSETSDSHSSPTSTQADAKYIVDILNEEVVIRASSEVLQENLELWKCMESYESDCAHNQPAEAESCGAGRMNVMDFLEPNQFATTNPKPVLEKIKSVSPSKRSSFHLEDDRNSCSSCFSKKIKLNNDNVTNSPGKYIQHFGSQCHSKSLNGHSSLPNKQAYAKHSFDILDVESQEGSILGAHNLVDAVPSEVKASFGNSSKDPVKEISRNFCVSSSRKAAKPKTSNTPITNSARFSSAGLMRDKENTQSTKMKYSSKRKIMNSVSTGPIRKPLRSVINQLIE